MSITLNIIICILIADFLTGLVHWLEDTYCLESIPILGKAVCKPNIDHHQFPTLMVKGAGIITTNWQSMFFASIVCVPFIIFGLFSWQLLLIALLGGIGNQIHCWNHMHKVNKYVAFLKDSGLIQSQKMHSLHHIPPYDKAYCILINFNNAWLDRINFWRKLEYLLDKVNIKVKRGSEERNGY